MSLLKNNEIMQQLKQNFSFYKTANLKAINTEEFKAYILSKIGQIDYQSEGYEYI